MSSIATHADLLGRNRELEVFAGALRSLASSRGSLVLVVGEAGIGKTRLVEHFAATSESAGVRVQWGRAWEGDGAPAYWPWIQALRPLIRSLEQDPAARETIVGLEFLRSILLDTAEPGPSDPVIESAAGRFRLFDAVTALLAVLTATAPLVLILEDLHWADRSSLALLEFVARDVIPLAITVVATAREGGGLSPASESFTSLARHRHVELLTLEGLLAGDAAILAQRVTGRMPQGRKLAALMEMSGGNPFFLAELARSVDGERPMTLQSRALPRTIQAAVGRRVEELAGDTRKVLEAASIIGREFSAGLVARMTGIDGAYSASLISQAERLRFVEPGHRPGKYRFTHAILRESLYQALAPDERMRLHLRLAEELETRTLGDGAFVSEIARHFVQSGPLADAEQAASWSVRAAREALARFAYLEAADWFEQAYDILDAAGASSAQEWFELHLARAEALDLGGERAAAWDGFLVAAAIARRESMLLEFARTAIRAGDGRTVLWNRNDGVIALIESALEGLGEGDGVLRVQLRARLAKALYNAELFDQAEVLSREAIAEARREGDAVALCTALDTRRYVVWQPDTAEERLQIGEEMRSEAAAAGLHEFELLGSHTRILALQDLGDVDALRDEILRHGRLADALCLPYWQCHNTMYRSVLAQLRGDFASAHELSERFATIGRRAEVPDTELWLIGQGIVFTWLQGSDHDWLRAGSDAGPAAAVLVTAGRPVVAAILAAVRSEAGDVKQSGANLARAFGPHLGALPRDFTRMATIAGLCCSAEALPADECAWLYELALPYARYNTMMGGSSSLGAFSRYLGRLAFRLERWDEAEQHFLAALDFNARMGALPWLAWTQHDYALALTRRGHPADQARVTALILEALSIVRTVHMPGLEAKLGRLGASPIPGKAGLPGGLTKREAEILVLLAQGLPNREIAGQLFLSVKTIERHLANAYTKMNVRNRVDAASFAREHGLLADSA